MFVIRFKNKNCWIAPWEGDPGRTLTLINAKKFYSNKSAVKEKHSIIMNNPHRFSALDELEVVSLNKL